MPTTIASPMVADPLWGHAGVQYATIPRDLFRQHFDAYENGRAGYCGVTSTADDEMRFRTSHGYTCTRDKHPDHWLHIAAGGREVISAWGGIDPVELNEKSDPDPDPTPGFRVEIGKLYKFRNKKTPLLPLARRGDGSIETLDLEHQRYRVLAEEKFAERKKDSPGLTPQQVQWMASFFAEKRRKSREVALEQRGAGYFKSDKEVNKVLEELGLEKHTPKRTGSVSVQFNVETVGLDQSDVERLLREWATTNTPTGLKGVTLTSSAPVVGASLRDTNSRY